MSAETASAEGAALGLVPSTTSDTAKPGKVEVCPFHSRAVRMRKSILTGARLLVEEGIRGGFRGRWAMVTATYRSDVEWEPLHVTALMKAMREWLKRRGAKARFVWCLELTKAKRPHYHVLVWLPRGLTIPKPDKRGWWQWGMTRVEWARRAVGYVAKYASKATPDAMVHLPAGARTHGVGGLTEEARRIVRWWKSPLFSRDALGDLADIRKVLGGYMNKVTGEFLASPWRVGVDGAGRVWAWRVNDEGLNP